MPTSARSAGRILFPAAALLTLLSACSVDTSVAVTATTAARVQHLYVTVTGVWLNTNATAAPGGAGWVGEKLATPTSVDLAALDGGGARTLVSGLKTPAGTYRQIRLQLADASAALTSSAQASGLNSNAQLQYLDGSGNPITLPLELPSPSSELILPATITLSSPVTAQLSSAANSGSTATASAPSASIAFDLDTIRNLLVFQYGNQTAALLNAAGGAQDSAKAGGISGTVDVSSIAAGTLTGPQGIVVSAERLGADGTRYEAVKNASLHGGGAFTLYPLPIAATGTTTYDVVIHGPGIRTLIITQVPATAGDATVATPIQSSAVTLAAATHYTVNTAANGVALPGGTQASFLQTIPGDPIPHLIENQTIDPFTGGFDANVSLSADAIEFGAYATGANVNFSTAPPAEGLGVYRVAAAAPFRAASALTTTISAPAAATSAVQPVFLPAIGTDNNAISLSGTLNFSRPRRFDNGFLIVSHGARIIDVRDLGASLTGSSASVAFTDPGLPLPDYDPNFNVSVRLWNSIDPAGTLTRVALADPVDVSRGAVGGLTLTVP